MISSCSATAGPLQEVVYLVLQFSIAWVAMSVTGFERSAQKTGSGDFGWWPRSASERSVCSGVALPGLELTQFQQRGLWIAIVKWRQFAPWLPHLQHEHNSHNTPSLRWLYIWLLIQHIIKFSFISIKFMSIFRDQRLRSLS